MTSRFGKTYSRRGGEGTSKFDEVLSNKRATLSTKWGETTYKAKVGSKRIGAPKNDSVLDIHKKPRLTDDSSEDPFGFDSDEESKPVSSRSVPLASSKASPAKPASAEPPQAERPDYSLDAGSKSSFQGWSQTSVPSRGQSSDRSQPRVVEDTARFFNSIITTTGKSQQSSSSSEKQHSYSWYRNASESDKKPLAQTTTLKTESKADSTYDAWDAIMGLHLPSPSQGPLNPPSTLWASTVVTASNNSLGQSLGPGHTREEKVPSPQRLQSPSEDLGSDLDFPVEPSEAEDHSHTSSSLVRNANCRTYRRPIKQGSRKASDSSSYTNNIFDAELPKVTSDRHNKTTSSGAGRGRTRDYTVLHPSSQSMCNVTNQERGVEEFNSGGAPSSGSVTAGSGATKELGEAGWQRKKTEPATTKLRFGSTQSKSKRDSKVNLFGFEEAETLQDENRTSNAAGSSSYKIKYFGFDDMSDSDEDEDFSTERRKAKRAAAAKAALAAAMEAPVDSPPDPFEMLESHERLEAKESLENTEKSQPVSRLRTEIEFSEESLRVVAMGPRRPPQGKPAEKNPDTHRRIFSAPKKSPTKAVYNARHWTVDSEEEPPPPFFSRPQTTPAAASAGATSKDSSSSQKDEGVFKAPPPPTKVIKSVTIPTDPYQDSVTALKCRKEHKELYTVVQHVKHFNDVVEFGENQEFTDDFEYLAAGLKSGQPLNTRCLSVISLATRCAMPSFRMHLRARGKVAQVFKTLNDAPQHPNLALCTASLMYILSRDRLNMDLDRSCLDLMIRLLELDQDQGGGTGADSTPQLSAREIAKVKEKIRKLCDKVHNKHLDLQNITTGHLAMETLLSLTSKRAGDWFKEELRLLGGLDHIVDKVKECVDNLSQEDDKEKLVSSLWGAERCLRVLESVTVHNPENQSYLIAYKDSRLIISSAKALQRCEAMIQRYSREVNSAGHNLPCSSNSNVGKAVEDCTRAIIGVLLNLTHDNEWGSTKTGEQEDLIVTALNCVLRVPQYLPAEQRFDIRVLGLGLLINLVEYSARNRHCLMEMEMEGGQGPCDTTVLLSPQHQDITNTGPLSAIAALVQLFLQREAAAVLAEAQTDDLIKEAPKPALDQSGEWQETGGEIQWVANDNNTDRQEEAKEKVEEDGEELDLNKALQHAGKHMEDSIVASYTALLLGCLCQGSPMNVTTVRENLPKGDFSIMTEMLKKFLNFMNLTCDVGTTGQKSISRVIDYLEHC
ncbi:wings apart-like protein homolog [Lampris incognitus]|uniref:wings apart-like protein homolog n=1 Tax=Lampris incognitus TaxID=2546036 RepID=UPI0024B56EFC|nr:wings apart-like protein homolog [Lampris incognitus]